MKKVLKRINCKHRMKIPTGHNWDDFFWACGCYHDTPRKDGREWGHFPTCTDRNCPKKHPELLDDAKR